MARKKQRPENITGLYFAIPKTVTDSESFKGATSTAKALLFALMQQHNGINNGHLHLTKGWLSKQGWTCDESNRKATKELIARELVIQTKWGGLNAGTNLYALTWYDISNYVGLDITSKGYLRGAYSLCKLPPTPRRKAPEKQKRHHDDRDSAISTTELAGDSAGSTSGSEKPLLHTFTSSTTENNVVIPLLPIKKTTKRIVGLKGKSGILKSKKTSFLYLMN